MQHRTALYSRTVQHRAAQKAARCSTVRFSRCHTVTHDAARCRTVRPHGAAPSHPNAAHIQHGAAPSKTLRHRASHGAARCRTVTHGAASRIFQEHTFVCRTPLASPFCHRFGRLLRKERLNMGKKRSRQRVGRVRACSAEQGRLLHALRCVGLSLLKYFRNRDGSSET